MFLFWKNLGKGRLKGGGEGASHVVELENQKFFPSPSEAAAIAALLYIFDFCPHTMDRNTSTKTWTARLVGWRAPVEFRAVAPEGEMGAPGGV